MRIAAVDHSFHAKTKSTEFIFDILAECGTVERFYCERWKGGPAVDLRKLRRGRYDAIVFIQQMYRRQELRQLGDSRKTVLVPMYDGVADWTLEKWRRYRSFQIVSFSSTLHQAAIAAGCLSNHVRYFPEIRCPEPAAGGDRQSGWTVFFWERQPSITWATVKSVLGDLPVAKVWYKPCPDPGTTASRISTEDRRRFNIEDVGWLPTRGDYLTLVSQSDIYFAPRRYEGIGMSFLEAMALGKLVVAADHATMNEYITHGHNGLLYDLADPRPVFTGRELPTIMRNAARDSREYANEWRRGQAALKTIIADACAQRSPPLGQLGHWFRGWMDRGA